MKILAVLAAIAAAVLTAAIASTFEQIRKAVRQIGITRGY